MIRACLWIASLSAIALVFSGNSERLLVAVGAVAIGAGIPWLTLAAARYRFAKGGGFL